MIREKRGRERIFPEVIPVWSLLWSWGLRFTRCFHTGVEL
jgi:hypothetical protein